MTGEDPLAEPMAELARIAAGRMIAVVVSVAQPYQQGVGSPAQPQGGTASETARPRAGWLTPFADDPAVAWSERLGVPVLFENDANLEAAGEAVQGAAAGEANVVYVKLGERSTGAGLILDGHLYRGANGFAGELAHVHFADNGKLCQCGGRGCLSTRLGPALLESIHETFGPDMTFRDVLARAEAGDPGPGRILGDVGRMVGRVMANLVTFLNPSVLVVDGTLGPAARFVAEGLRDSIEHYTSPIAASALRIEVGSLGERADLFGAIAVARDHAVSHPAARLAPGA
jgi:predicted NBD/HSP70 family sugar kinase